MKNKTLITVKRMFMVHGEITLILPFAGVMHMYAMMSR